mmetsp:Transcript_18668/g.36542  ORF Transcript_18668/g.36542 Transcript_18668/m.36542 type:complete len:204 (+) Transcript_18668:387-998(+)
MMRKASLEALTRMKKAFLVANAQNESSMGFVLLVNKAEVGNKTKQQVFPEDVVEWCEANGVDLFFETSAAVDTNIVPALVQIAQLAKDMDMARKGIVVPRRTNLHAADTAPSPELQQELTADQLLQKEQDDFFAGMSYDNTAAAVEAAAAAAAAFCALRRASLSRAFLLFSSIRRFFSSSALMSALITCATLTLASGAKAGRL